MSDDPTDEAADAATDAAADAAAELRALRLRAYGPDADIRDDPEALRRLHELEGRTAGTPAGEVPRPGEPGEVSTVREEPPAGPPAREPVAKTPWWERHRTLLWGGSLVIAAVLGVAVGSVQLPPDREQVAVLGADADGQWPEQMWGARPPDGVTYEEYLGLTAIASARDFGNGTNSTCLWVYDSASVNFGLSAGSCAAGSAPASTTIAVTAQAPPALLEEFGEGTTLQFVRDDDRVIVYA
ncbi:hypothetical protein ACFC1I_07810 [Microbacterium sp. NPDC056044]|uniref:hypothetical protein n=1 Tax=Microbacterium sp. NPDC056044 TaxID=3345690 RepID=UPI0035DEEEF4